MNYIKPDKSKHLYILGFDFGHGETSVDKCDIQWNATYSQLGSPESIEIFKLRKRKHSKIESRKRLQCLECQILEKLYI